MRTNKASSGVLLLLTTLGGDADAAYRMGRLLQRNYQRVEIFIHSFCKSAGTLLATSAHEIIMSDSAELGPLDVQLRKPDEIDERTSGLAATQAISSLRVSSYNAFEHFFIKIRRRTRISSRIAADVAANLTVGLFSPIYEQLEPLRLGENDRSVQVAEEYVKRLSKNGDNINTEGLPDLIAGFPSHGFVIDREEASRFFKSVRAPSALELDLALELELLSLRKTVYVSEQDGDDQSVVLYLSGTNGESNGTDNNPSSTKTDEHSGSGSEGSGPTGESSGGDSSGGGESPC